MWCSPNSCASNINIRGDPENECPRYQRFSAEGIRSVSCCGTSPDGGCLVRRLTVSANPMIEVDSYNLEVEVSSSDRLEFRDSYLCGLLDDGDFGGQDCAGDDNILGATEVINGRCLGALNELQVGMVIGDPVVGIRNIGVPIQGRIGCNPSTGLGTWSEDRGFRNGMRWTGKQIGRARAPKYCEGFALRQPVYISTLGKMYDGNRWFCLKEGCWYSGFRCGRDGGWGQSDLGCFRDHRSMNGKRYWGGCCSGEIEYDSGTYSYWYKCK